MRSDDDLDLAVLYALNALEGAEQAAIDSRLVGDAELASTVARFQAVLEAVALDTATAPPAELAGKITQTARAQRSAGEPTGRWATKIIDPIECGERAMRQFMAVLASLGDSDWTKPCPPFDGWTVRDLVAHVIAVERQLAAQLGVGAFVVPPQADSTGISDHLEFTRPLIAELSSAPASYLPDLLAATAKPLSKVFASFDQEALRRTRIKLVGVPSVSVQTALLVRTFELWTHGEDICRAVGRPVPGLDPDQLRLLCGLAVEIVPGGVAMRGSHRRGRVRIVLTGPGGGAWTANIGVGPDPTDPAQHDALLVADALSFCRLAARRVTPDELAGSVTGDGSLVDEALAGAAMFAA
jgi:uncharacterized protein (TIGR03083 family)